jgi:peptidyl-tRNA hydrolase
MIDPDIQAMLDASKESMKAFTDDYRPLYMYGIFRQDLEMTAGKLCAQSGHTFEMAYKKAEIERPDITSQYKGTGNGTKICMWARNLGQLIRAYRDCQSANIPCKIIIDRSSIMLPHFDGNPIITALGIGPAYKDEMAHITKRYTLIK